MVRARSSQFQCFGRNVSQARYAEATGLSVLPLSGVTGNPPASQDKCDSAVSDLIKHIENVNTNATRGGEGSESSDSVLEAVAHILSTHADMFLQSAAWVGPSALLTNFSLADIDRVASGFSQRSTGFGFQPQLDWNTTASLLRFCRVSLDEEDGQTQQQLSTAAQLCFRLIQCSLRSEGVACARSNFTTSLCACPVDRRGSNCSQAVPVGCKIDTVPPGFESESFDSDGMHKRRCAQPTVLGFDGSGGTDGSGSSGQSGGESGGGGLGDGQPWKGAQRALSTKEAEEVFAMRRFDENFDGDQPCLFVETTSFLVSVQVTLDCRFILKRGPAAEGLDKKAAKQLTDQGFVLDADDVKAVNFSYALKREADPESESQLPLLALTQLSSVSLEAVIPNFYDLSNPLVFSATASPAVLRGAAPMDIVLHASKGPVPLDGENAADLPSEFAVGGRIYVEVGLAESDEEFALANIHGDFALLAVFGSYLCFAACLTCCPL